MPYSRGDVVLVMFPDSNLRTAKRRPALVVQADNLKTGLAQTIVAMISSNMSRAGHPTRVTIHHASTDGQQMGLHTDSVVMTDNLATVFENEIDRAIGKCPEGAHLPDALLPVADARRSCAPRFLHTTQPRRTRPGDCDHS